MRHVNILIIMDNLPPVCFSWIWNPSAATNSQLPLSSQRNAWFRNFKYRTECVVSKFELRNERVVLKCKWVRAHASGMDGPPPATATRKRGVTAARGSRVRTPVSRSVKVKNCQDKRGERREGKDTSSERQRHSTSARPEGQVQPLEFRRNRVLWGYRRCGSQ